MASNQFHDFSELYRAAFAEQNPEKKLQLLSAVQRAIREWEMLPSGEGVPPRFAPQVPFSLASTRHIA
jgi:hypothetical protein